MWNVRQIRVPAELIRVGDYVPLGGWVTKIVKSRTKGLFPKRYVTLTFLWGHDLIDYTVEDHLPVDIERSYEQIIANKEKK
jgi:hypothetical protein